MFSFRRLTASRAFASITSAAPVVRCSRTLHVASSSSRPVARAIGLYKPVAFSPFRRYATEEESREKDAEDERIENVQKSTIDSAINSAKETVSNVTQAVQSGAAAATNAVAGKVNEHGVYVGNLYFEVTDEQLGTEFASFGDVTGVKIVKDLRGLSKGFGYVTFADTESVQRAISEMNNQIWCGRRLTVQPAIKKDASRPKPNAPVGFNNPPSKTIFIGNMSYEMTDKDLNDLFRQIGNVKDVRVAIDRRSGQPRGFAHADFADIESAEKAAEFLRDQEFYGRRLRIDYSTQARRD